MKTIAIITTSARSLVIFRASFIKLLIESNYEVYTLAPDFSADQRKAVISLGAKPIDISLQHTSLSPVSAMISIVRLTLVLRKIKPQITLSYFLKPVIFGSISSFFSKVPRHYSMIEGLGRIFVDNDNLNIKHNLLKFSVINLLKISLKFSKKVVFLNRDDINDFVSYKILERKKACLIGGIGVDLKFWKRSTKSVKSDMSFIYASRLIKEKGICDYIESARIIKQSHPHVKFYVLGGCDNFSCTPEVEKMLTMAHNKGTLQWVGYINDVKSWLEKSDIFVLPSYYREGVPRATQEAMSMGLPIITCDTPGNRETVIDGQNGYFVRARDPVALAKKMDNFIKNPILAVDMGEQSRRMAIERFDEDMFNRRLLEVICFPD